VVISVLIGTSRAKASRTGERDSARTAKVGAAAAAEPLRSVDLLDGALQQHDWPRHQVALFERKADRLPTL
jgi:hypothetical protein